MCIPLGQHEFPPKRIELRKISSLSNQTPAWLISALLAKGLPSPQDRYIITTKRAEPGFYQEYSSSLVIPISMRIRKNNHNGCQSAEAL